MIEFSIIDSDGDKLTLSGLVDLDLGTVAQIQTYGSGAVYLTQDDVARLIEELSRFMPPKVVLPAPQWGQGGLITSPHTINLL